MMGNVRGKNIAQTANGFDQQRLVRIDLNFRRSRMINTSIVRSKTSALSLWVSSSSCSRLSTRRAFCVNASSRSYSPPG